MVQIDYATSVVAASTVVLAIITFVYMWETRRIRLLAQRPSFSLETGMISLSESPISMELVNTGEAATDLRIDCSWSGGDKKLYAVSLSKHGHLILKDLPVPIISQNLGTLIVKIVCKDSIGNPYASPEIKMDFSIPKSEKREVTYQYNPIENSLRDIAIYAKHNL